MTLNTGRIWSRHPSDCGSVMTYTEVDGTTKHLFVFDNRFRKLLPFHDSWTPPKVPINDWDATTFKIGTLTDEEINKLPFQDKSTPEENRNRLVWTTPEKYCPAMYHTQSCSITVDGKKVTGCIPTIQQLIRIYCDRDILTDLDKENTGRSTLLYSYFAASSTYHSSRYIWTVGYNGHITPQNLEYSETYIIPVIELDEYTHTSDVKTNFETSYSVNLLCTTPIDTGYSVSESVVTTPDYFASESSKFSVEYSYSDVFFKTEYTASDITKLQIGYTNKEVSIFHPSYATTFYTGYSAEQSGTMTVGYSNEEKNTFSVTYGKMEQGEIPVWYKAKETGLNYTIEYTG